MSEIRIGIFVNRLSSRPGAFNPLVPVASGGGVLNLAPFWRLNGVQLFQDRMNAELAVMVFPAKLLSPDQTSITMTIGN